MSHSTNSILGTQTASGGSQGNQRRGTIPWRAVQEGNNMDRTRGPPQRPQHKVREQPVSDSVQVRASEESMATSREAIQVNEDSHPDRYYLPREDVRMAMLQPSDTRIECPFKGRASCFNIALEDRVLEDAAWSYETPYDEHAALKDRIAFGDDKPELSIKVNGAPP